MDALMWIELCNRQICGAPPGRRVERRPADPLLAERKKRDSFFISDNAQSKLSVHSCSFESHPAILKCFPGGCNAQNI